MRILAGILIGIAAATAAAADLLSIYRDAQSEDAVFAAKRRRGVVDESLLGWRLRAGTGQQSDSHERPCVLQEFFSGLAEVCSSAPPSMEAVSMACQANFVISCGSS